ncbi:MAG: hypothetical protein UU47_C0018G0013 [candidate division TM6 bacterium GW2011_GWE2_41_16]|nr:MAG: hypothetical protein UU47_C0018G0013 [candidate division TM6 bacterium GW2011_GWE2_41_16]
MNTQTQTLLLFFLTVLGFAPLYCMQEQALTTTHIQTTTTTCTAGNLYQRTGPLRLVDGRLCDIETFCNFISDHAQEIEILICPSWIDGSTLNEITKKCCNISTLSVANCYKLMPETKEKPSDDFALIARLPKLIGLNVADTKIKQLSLHPHVQLETLCIDRCNNIHFPSLLVCKNLRTLCAALTKLDQPTLDTLLAQCSTKLRLLKLFGCAA